MAAEFHASRASDEAPSETDRPQLIQPPRPQVPTSTVIAAELADSHTSDTMPPSTATAGVRVRERRLSSTPSTASNVAPDVGAPVVWTTPDWAAHPVIESYYGHARRARENSFYEVMQSPTNTLATRTLAESCNSYDRSEASDDNEDDADAGDSHGEDGSRGPRRRGNLAPTQKLGSFSFSYTTETSDELVGASPSFSTSSAESGYELHPRVHASTMATIASVAGSGRADRGGHKAAAAATPKKTSVHGGYAHWNRQRLPTDLVPVPHPTGRMKTSAATLDAVHSATRNYTHDEDNPQPADIGNPQGGHAGDGSSSEDPESPTHARSRAARTSGRLRTKLEECRAQIDERIQIEAAFARDAHACLTRSTAAAAAATKRESLMWSLLCGAHTSSSSASFGGSSKSGLTNAFDGIDFLHDRLAVAVHHRALNQLQRHRRHVNGILQIVTSHNPDLGLTERQLDSFESADAMLANDVKYLTLSRQVAALLTTRRKRVDARRHATIQNGRDCFESPRVKRAMLAKLLEAVSWYRLVQTNAREESASTSVGLSVEAAAATGCPTAQSAAGVSNPDGHEASLSSGSSGSSSRSSLSASRSLQELQVERILSVLAGEEFYSDYNELMCQPDWWEIAQAHFENIVFSTPDSRVAQWVQRVSRDVAAVCYEPLEEEVSYLRLDEKKPKTSKNSNPAAMMATQPPAEWTKDPQPEQILEFVDRVTRRIRKELDVPNDVTKSLNVFVQRMVFPRLALLCFNQKTLIDCQRKDKLWRKQCVDLSGIPLENLNVGSDLAGKIRSKLPCRRVAGGRRAFLIRAIDAFNCMTSVVPCDLLDELMYGVVILHHEAALVLGTTQFSVETFFPLLTYVLLHCNLPTIHAQLQLLENYAITHSNANGEESYYVYCVHAAVEYVCNSSGLTTTPPPPAAAPTLEEPRVHDTTAHADPVDACDQDGHSAVASAVPVVAAV